MKLFFPKNIFSNIIKNVLPSDLGNEVNFLPSPLIAGEVAKDSNSIGLIPTLDLISHKEFFISKSFGISFENALCNSYIYYNSNVKNISEIYLGGDVSSLEVILTKILFEEMYDASVDVKIAPDISLINNHHILLVGDKNFEDEKFSTGVSFAEEIMDAFSFPFVNYVFASSSKHLIEELNNHLAGSGLLIYEKVESESFGEGISLKAKKYIRENISSFIFDLDEQDMDGINQLIQLPFLRGIVNDITEVKFV
jgi:hypothetical protein